MNFVRGLDPKEAMGTGWRAILSSMKYCLLITEKDLYQNINNQYYDLETVKVTNIRKQSRFLYDAYVIIVVIGDNFKIFKNRISNDENQIYKIEELPEIILKIKKIYDETHEKRN